MSIKAKLSWLLIFWSLLILLISNSIIYFSYSKLIEKRELESLEDTGESLLETVDKQELFSPSMATILQSFLPNDGIIRIIDEDNNIISQTSDEEDLLELPLNKSSVSKQANIVQFDDETIAVFTVPIMENRNMLGTLELSRSLDDQMEDIEILLVLFISVSIVIIVLAIFFGKAASSRFLRPLSIIGTTMNNIQKNGRFEKIHLPQKSKDEISQLATNFNHMIDFLEEAFHKQETFISDASHELKTPLTVIENYASMLNRWGKDDPDLLKEGIDTIQDESKRIKYMVEQLLDLASIHNQPYELEMINITELCKQTAKRLELSTNRTIRVMSDSESIIGVSNKDKFIQILFILLDNALKYSNKEIVIEITNQDNHPQIRIIDHGIGIPKEDISKLFDRFYRVDKARTRTTGGTGLGLAIAHSLIKQSNGSISIESEPNKGTIVTLRLKSKI